MFLFKRRRECLTIVIFNLGRFASKDIEEFCARITCKSYTELLSAMREISVGFGVRFRLTNANEGEAAK